MLAQVKSDLASGFSMLNFPKCLCEIPTRSGRAHRAFPGGIPSALVRPSPRQCDADVVVVIIVLPDLVSVAHMLASLGFPYAPSAHTYGNF